MKYTEEVTEARRYKTEAAAKSAATKYNKWRNGYNHYAADEYLGEYQNSELVWTVAAVRLSETMLEFYAERGTYHYDEERNGPLHLLNGGPKHMQIDNVYVSQ